MSMLRRQIIAAIDDFCLETGMSDSRVGREAVHDGHLVRRLRLGYGTQLGTLERLESYMAAERARRAEGFAEAA